VLDELPTSMISKLDDKPSLTYISTNNLANIQYALDLNDISMSIVFARELLTSLNTFVDHNFKGNPGRFTQIGVLLTTLDLSLKHVF
jgi:hypothetical protein